MCLKCPRFVFSGCCCIQIVPLNDSGNVFDLPFESIPTRFRVVASQIFLFVLNMKYKCPGCFFLIRWELQHRARPWLPPYCPLGICPENRSGIPSGVRRIVSAFAYDGCIRFNADVVWQNNLHFGRASLEHGWRQNKCFELRTVVLHAMRRLLLCSGYEDVEIGYKSGSKS